MKQAFLLRFSHGGGGGIESQVLQIAGEMRKRGILEPVLVTDQTQSRLARDFSTQVGEVLFVPTGLLGIFPAAYLILREIFRGRPVALLQSHHFRESLVARLVRWSNPNLVHVFRVQTYFEDARIPSWRKVAYYRLDALTSGWVDCYLANGTHIAQALWRYARIPKRQVRVIWDGRPDIGVPDDPTTTPEAALSRQVALVARIDGQKGHDDLIRTLALLRGQGLLIQARFIGEESGTLKDKISVSEKIKRLAEELGVRSQITFSGYISDVARELADIPVVVLPSLREGVPNVLIEAMSLRKLVVASRVGGVPAMIENGINGFLHEPRDVAGLANILGRIFCTPAISWESMRDAARETWQRRFSLDAQMTCLLDIYRDLKVIGTEVVAEL